MKKFPLFGFMVAGFVGVAVVTAILAILLNSRAQSAFSERSTGQGSTEVSHTLQMFYYNMLAPQLEDNPGLTIEQAINPQMMGMFAKRTTFGLNVVRISVFDPQGNLAYSSDPEFVVIAESERDPFEQAVQGIPSSTLASGTAVTDLAGERRELDAVQSYIAIRETAPDSGQEGRILGVLSISQDVTDAFAAARFDALRNAVIASATTGGVLFFLLFSIVFRADRTIAKAYKKLRAQQEKLKREIEERKRAEETIRHRAYHDGLTGLPNRVLLMDRLTQALAQAKRHKHTVAVMFSRPR